MNLGGLVVEPGLALRLMLVVVSGALLSYLGAVLVAEPGSYKGGHQYGGLERSDPVLLLC